MNSDARIIKLVLGGKTSAFRELIERHQSAVYRLAYRILGSREDAEDTVQETFLRVYQNLASYEGKGPFGAWVRRIAINVSIRRIRREVPSDDVELMRDSELTDEDPVEAEVLRQVTKDEVRTAVAGLPDSMRVAVVLHYQEDLSCKEIAGMLGEPVATIQVRLHRARKLLARRLAVTVGDGVY